MGVNMAGNCIFDDEACQEASRQEIIRRYYTAAADEVSSLGKAETVYKLKLLLEQPKVKLDDRPAAKKAHEMMKEYSFPIAAMELPNGKIVTGKTTDLLGCCSALLLNALKELAGIDEDLHLISPDGIRPIQTLKTAYLGSKNPRLHTDEVLIALSTSAEEDEFAKKALSA